MILNSNVESNIYQNFKFSISNELLDEWWGWIEAYKNEEVEKAIREERIETVKALKKAVARWNDFSDYGTLEEYIETIIKVLSPIS